MGAHKNFPFFWLSMWVFLFPGPDPHLCGLLQKPLWSKWPVLQCQSDDWGSKYKNKYLGSECSFVFLLSYPFLFSCSTAKRWGKPSQSISQTTQSLSKASSFSQESKVFHIKRKQAIHIYGSALTPTRSEWKWSTRTRRKAQRKRLVFPYWTVLILLFPQVIGTTSINVWSLIEQPNMEYRLQPFILKVVRDGCFFRTHLRTAGPIPFYPGELSDCPDCPLSIPPRSCSSNTRWLRSLHDHPLIFQHKVVPGVLKIRSVHTELPHQV